MSNILDIPQIPEFHLDVLQRDLHIGFGGDIAKRLQKARWTDDTRALRLMLNAQAITQADNYLYTELIGSIAETIRYYRQIADDRRRTSRRVSVKSDIVGNKLYATVSGSVTGPISTSPYTYKP